ncbi:DUF805 domain-containing protein [Metabacillus fastidiosus]|uniref:DUF805 domain-containing protein n=1 Tax=Metabacillus fastidiosus TaxID=1458 RepID=A0ABU6NZF5_9BACI|nr:DUF805 domain-containing protein [Metabacillus fastidiosus]MED4402480.1 DUF805 domain-containing protein [Metabacillus fastidiosus]MED4461767.1 DUF805 domain-containing protein [Metabacillus fastidiosus]
MHWYLRVLKNYVTFEGRARRKEYWMFYLINAIISIILITAERATDTFFFSLLNFLYALAILLPSLAVAVRRLHDTGRSGWWFLINLIPIIGAIVFLIFTCLDSESNSNKYGPNPKH